MSIVLFAALIWLGVVWWMYWKAKRVISNPRLEDGTAGEENIVVDGDTKLEGEGVQIAVLTLESKKR
jgi:hypothetical protein